MTKTVLGIIGGSGVYDIDGLENARWQTVKSPWGEPSDQLLTGTFQGVDLVFLPRHGRGHVQTPTSINYRANIDALKRIGVTDVISVSACGSLTEELPPGTFVMADQFIDRTFAREKSFFGPGFVAHVPMAHPVCPRLSGALTLAAREQKIDHSEGGTYICMEGPQFSTRAESFLYRSWDCSVIGMTAMPEAKLAREAELPYAIVAMVTDYDCWHDDHEHVTVDAVIKVMHGNAANAPQADHGGGAQAGTGAPALSAGGGNHAGHGADHRARQARSRADGQAGCRGGPRSEERLTSWTSKSAIRTIPDYPKKGIMFRDITTLLGDARAFRRAVDEWCSLMPASGSTRWRGSKRGASSWAAPSPTSFPSALCRCARRASCPIP